MHGISHSDLVMNNDEELHEMSQQSRFLPNGLVINSSTACVMPFHEKFQGGWGSAINMDHHLRANQGIATSVIKIQTGIV